MPQRDLNGQVFTRWTVLHKNTMPSKYPSWMCRCACGTIKLVDERNLVKQTTRSCGCLIADTVRQLKTTHGQAGTGRQSKEYRAWCHAKNRCLNPKVPEYFRYGGRGITICDDWKNDFTRFLEHIGVAPSPHHSLDRINVHGHYEPGNCRWATMKEQARNRRASTSIVYQGVTMTVSECAERLGVKRGRLHYYYKTRHMPALEAIDRARTAKP